MEGDDRRQRLGRRRRRVQLMNPAVVAAIGGAQMSLMTAAAAGGFAFANAEAAAVVAAMVNPPDDARKQLIDDLVGALKSGATSGSDIWAKLDLLYILAAADQQAALLDWKGGGFDGAITGTGTFTADRGWQGDGASGYIDTGFNPTTAPAPNYALNSAHIWLWSRTSGQDSTANDMGASSQLEMGVRSSSDSANFTINSSIGGIGHQNVVLSQIDGSGLFMLNRSGNSTEEAYRNGVPLTFTSGARTSSGIPNSNITIGMKDGQFSLRQFAAAGVGGSLNAAEALDLYNALQAYMTGVGA
ncbi:MAG TPA: hypothetical protein VFW19_13955 [Allosphingosinicella sp.]|nr:hypothetical protein [Allosphingosinicella sp.]